MFDDISPEYDRLNHVLSMNIDKGWRRKAVRWIVDTDRPLKVLDVACGTGDLSIAIASRALKTTVLFPAPDGPDITISFPL